MSLSKESSTQQEMPELDDATEKIDEVGQDKLAADWMKSELDKEMTRITGMGQKAIPIPVRNMATVRNKNGIIMNRVEFSTAYDFNNVFEVMVSEPIPCSVKKGFEYVNVLLFGQNKIAPDKPPLPMIMPYLYFKDPKNTLQEWIFINSKNERSHHRIDSFRE